MIAGCRDSADFSWGESGVSIVQPAGGLPAGFWDGPAQAGLFDEPGGLSGRTALAQPGRRAPANQR